MRKWNFQKLPDIICVRKGEKWHIRAHDLFWPKMFWAKPATTKKNKNSGLDGIASKQKWHFFEKKKGFGMGEKEGFTSCVFEKLCSAENTICIVFPARHSSCSKKTVF